MADAGDAGFKKPLPDNQGKNSGAKVPPGSGKRILDAEKAAGKAKKKGK